jgi:FkbM family methyltransferase
LFAQTEAYGLDFTYAEADSGIGPCLAEFGEFARVELDLIEVYMRDRKGTFLDVGANIGAISLPIAARLPDCRIISVEANRRIAAILCANAVNNRLGNVDVITAALGRGSGLAKFPTPPLTTRLSYGELGKHLADTMPTEVVRLCALDDIAPDDTRLVKVDVEGAEETVLEGAGRVLREVRPVWVIEANPRTRAQTARVMRTLIEAQYRLFWLYTPFVLPKPARGAPRGPALIDLNFVALPPGAENVWDLPAIVDVNAAWPSSRQGFPYFANYE